MNPELNKVIFSYPKLQEFLGKQKKDLTDKVLKNIEEIRADYNPTYINGMKRLLDKALGKLYDDIDFDDNNLDVINLVENNCVVFVPNHQSHVDYLAINYIFYNKYRRPLYVAGGSNLNIFPIGTLFRKSGCFFIRRSFYSDASYKLTLEAYLYYLLKERKPIEFFFEGGRSRSGKLRAPRYGLYQMLIEAHSHLKGEDKAPLMFIPTSIVHEYVPEQKALADEMGGAKKKKESTKQLLGLFKFVAYQFGTIYIRLSKPIIAEKINDETLKPYTQSLAFDCFRAVGKNMMVTPTSLLAMVLLDEPEGALAWTDILIQARSILDYCYRFDVPVTDSLRSDKDEASLERAIDILIGNKKIKVIGKEYRGRRYYSIDEESRLEILYFKNTILHHFLVPWVINTALISLFLGKIKTSADLKNFFLDEREQLKHEFYLPTVKEFFHKTLEIVSDATGKEVTTVDDLMKLDHKELYLIVSKVGMFRRSLSYINECYYVSLLTLQSLGNNNGDKIKRDYFESEMKSLFDQERKIAKIIKFAEGYSIPMAKTSLKYFEQEKLIELGGSEITFINLEEIKKRCEVYEQDLSERLTVNIRPRENH